MESIQFLLKALGCPFCNEFDATSHTHVVSMVRWLEDRKIREYEFQERTTLHDSERWNEHFAEYLTRLGCPFTWSPGSLEVLYWLVSYAVSLDYDDSEIQTNDPVPSSSSVAGSIDEVGRTIALVRSHAESDTDYLARIFQKLKYQLSPNAIEAKGMAHSFGNSQDEALKNFPLGFDTHDKLVNQVALVMKMLYLSDFRDLQNEINSLLVVVQDYTANPRLNASLGRVGV